MGNLAREHITGLTVILTVISLALVFGAVGGQIPRWLLPSGPDALLSTIPHVNAAISVTAIAIIWRGWYEIRRGNVTRHRLSMGTGFLLFLLFLVLYLYKVALEGPTEFPGPSGLYTFVYLPILGIHILLAVVCLPLLYYVLLLALTRPVEEIPASNHPRIGRITVVLWLVSFALGLVVYGMLYLVPFGSP